MTRLCELATKYGSDKRAGGYTEFYDLILRARAVRKVLEIGIGTPEAMQHVPGYQPGASLRMWAEYFPEAEIYGIDVDRVCGIAALQNACPRIRARVCDQSKRSELVMTAQEFGGEFDLIVDDGSHQHKDQLLSAITLMPFVAPGGLYIIEDAANVGPELPFPHYEVRGSTGGRLILIQKGADGQ